MRYLVITLGILALAIPAVAELQNVQVGGQIVIRARYWNNVYTGGPGGPQVVRIPAAQLPKRAIGPFGTASRYRWDDQFGNNLDFIEHRTRLNVKADFTNDVSAFIELEAYDRWGEDFRSDYITGADFAGVTNNDVEVYQSYIQADNFFIDNLRLRVGRQEMKLGKGWLVDDITTALIGRSFDAVRLTYATDLFNIDGFYSILQENFAAEEDGDITFAGVYGTYTGLEQLAISGYWLWIRDPRSLNDTAFVAPIEWLEDLFGLDDYDTTNLHTIGLRAFGATGPIDYDLELAYQFGDADAVGAGFIPNGGIYGDDDAEWENWAGDVEVGYSPDLPWSPRFYLGAAYFDGEDRRDLSFWDWLNPFYRSSASVSFNRLFPGKPYSLVLEIGQDMSNFWQVRGGVVLKPTEAITANTLIAYFNMVEPWDAPVSIGPIGGFLIPVAPNLSFWTSENDDDIGWIIREVINYQYSEDLYFRIGAEYLFTGDGLAQGGFHYRNGLEFGGGTDDENAYYLFAETGLKF
jgi:hypothetical protein